VTDIYGMDSHKLVHHLDRVTAWQKGDRIVPIHIDAGLSKGCNIRCHYCFGAMQGNLYGPGSKTVFPRDALMEYVRDAALLGVRSMGFIGEAEPTLNPTLSDAIITGRVNGMDMALGTNGILLDTSGVGATALEALTWIRFNISAASAESYLKLHGSKMFDKVIKNIRWCVETKHRLNLDVTIGLQMVLTPQNAMEAVPLAELGRSLGVDYLVIKQCSDTQADDLGVYGQLYGYLNYADILRTAEAQGTPAYNVTAKWGKIMNEGVREYDRCLATPFLLYSSGDGRLYPCGQWFVDREEEFRMGDLTKQSFKEIWESDRYWDVVERVKEVDVCKTCYANCRSHYLADFLWKLKNPPPHKNFV